MAQNYLFGNSYWSFHIFLERFYNEFLFLFNLIKQKIISFFETSPNILFVIIFFQKELYYDFLNK